jgi:hypothetical protein
MEQPDDSLASRFGERRGVTETKAGGGDGNSEKHFF